MPQSRSQEKYIRDLAGQISSADCISNPGRTLSGGYDLATMLMPVDMPHPNGELRSERCLLDLEREGAVIDKGRARDHVKYVRGKDLQIVRACWEKRN